MELFELLFELVSDVFLVLKHRRGQLGAGAAVHLHDLFDVSGRALLMDNMTRV